ILQQNVQVCLSNGSNCVSGNNTGNISSLVAGTGISITNPSGPTATIAVDGTVCTTGNGLCAQSLSSAGGWRNSSTLVTLSSNATNVSIGNTTGNQPVLFIDNANGRVGIGAASPQFSLDINTSWVQMRLKDPSTAEYTKLGSGSLGFTIAGRSLEYMRILH